MLDIRPHVRDAKDQAVVALESTLIAHGLPWPINYETARAAEESVREEGAIPATIAVLEGCPTIGLTEDEMHHLAQAKDVRKASQRDLASAMVDKATAATTVAATLCLAHRASIRVFATGGIGGVHPPQGDQQAWDVSADLHELARTPMIVVCAGAKTILDLAATLEVLESFNVPVVGFGTDEFPAFYARTSGLPVSCRIDSVERVAEFASTHWQLGGAGVVVALPIKEQVEVPRATLNRALVDADLLAEEARVGGSELTPFLLARLAELTQGSTLTANRALIEANARLAARIASVLCRS